MTTIQITETAYTVTATGANQVTVTESPTTVEVRGGIASSVADLTTQAPVSRIEHDILAWNAAASQYEPARISASGGITLSYVFLSDLDYDDGSWDFSFAEASGHLVVSGLV